MVIRLENLEVGMTLKNYKELCKILEVEYIQGGYSRQKQMAWFDEYFSYEKEGHKFIITEIYDKEVEPMKDNRGGGNVIEHPNFLVCRNDWDSIGVYKIVLSNDIYIGSTIVGFRIRFLGHTYKDNLLPTREMIENGAVFKIIKKCNGMSETYIREEEERWIEYYKNKPGWTVVNQREPIDCSSAQPKIKYKKIMVDIGQYNKVIQFLDNNDITYR